MRASRCYVCLRVSHRIIERADARDTGSSGVCSAPFMRRRNAAIKPKHTTTEKCLKTRQELVAAVQLPPTMPDSVPGASARKHGVWRPFGRRAFKRDAAFTREPQTGTVHPRKHAARVYARSKRYVENARRVPGQKTRHERHQKSPRQELVTSYAIGWFVHVVAR